MGTVVGIGIGLMFASVSDETKEELTKGAKKLAAALQDTARKAVDDLYKEVAKTTDPISN